MTIEYIKKLLKLNRHGAVIKIIDDNLNMWSINNFYDILIIACGTKGLEYFSELVAMYLLDNLKYTHRDILYNLCNMEYTWYEFYKNLYEFGRGKHICINTFVQISACINNSVRLYKLCEYTGDFELLTMSKYIVFDPNVKITDVIKYYTNYIEYANCKYIKLYCLKHLPFEYTYKIYQDSIYTQSEGRIIKKICKNMMDRYETGDISGGNMYRRMYIDYNSSDDNNYIERTYKMRYLYKHVKDDDVDNFIKIPFKFDTYTFPRIMHKVDKFNSINIYKYFIHCYCKHIKSNDASFITPYVDYVQHDIDSKLCRYLSSSRDGFLLDKDFTSLIKKINANKYHKKTQRILYGKTRNIKI